MINMPSIDTDTRLIMTILFVGAVSGLNIYVYALVGTSFPYSGVAHAVLFGVSTVGGIMILKVILDLIANDFIEEFLLKRRIDAYWARKAREEENRKRVRDSFRQFQQNWNQTVVSPPNVYGDSNLPNLNPNTPGSFLTLETEQ